MIKYFKKPYPLIIDDGYLFPSIVDLIIGLVVFFVLIIFKPTLFFDPIPQYTLANCAFFGLIAFLVSIIHTNVLPRIFTSFFNSNKWTIGKELAFQASIVIGISITNYLAYIIVFQSEISFKVDSFIQMLLSSLVLAFIPLMIVTIILQRYHFNKMIKESSELKDVISTLTSPTINPSKVTINGEGKNEELKVIANQIIYIESSANYCDICYLEGEEVKKSIFRISLTTIQSVLIEYPSFIKTHRSYIVNINHIMDVKGNAQGYRLTLNHINDTTIPVSRSNVNKLNDLVQS
jgi:DNA-binding LytR/AlgR family response regulator